MTESLLRRSPFRAGSAVAGTIGFEGSVMAEAWATAAAPRTPNGALAVLLAGNRRFVGGHAEHPRQTPTRVKQIAAHQDPFAIVLGCADSRVGAELLFDQGLGDLFVNRVAGNLVDDLLLGSMEYAVEEFAPPLLIVLGHERCGAIQSTIAAINGGGTAPGHIGAILAALEPIVAPYAKDADAVEAGVRANVKAQAAAILAQSGIVRERVEKGAMAVVGARYNMDTGWVEVLG